MAGLRGKPRPPVNEAAALIGDAIRMRRTSVAVNKRQEDVALDAGVSQKIVSQIELGQQDLRLSGLATIMGILKAVKWTLTDLQRVTDIDLGSEQDPAPFAPRRGGPPIPLVVGPIDVPLEIPHELQELIDEYGDRPGYEALKNRKSLQTLSVHRVYLGEEDGPQTADQWHEYFLSLRRWLPK